MFLRRCSCGDFRGIEDREDGPGFDQTTLSNVFKKICV
jgi:hypothetical protein